jgi:hypothetical protein
LQTLIQFATPFQAIARSQRNWAWRGSVLFGKNQHFRGITEFTQVLA